MFHFGWCHQQLPGTASPRTDKEDLGRWGGDDDLDDICECEHLDCIAYIDKLTYIVYRVYIEKYINK